jgi:general secretion pathway protein B
MSYILDALRKSDQQRRRGGVPTLATAPAARAAAERPAFLWYGLLGVVLIAVGMAIGWLRPWRSEPLAIPPIAANPLESSRQQTPQATPTPVPEAAAKLQPPPRHDPSAAPAVPALAAPTPRRPVPASTKAEPQGTAPMAVAGKPREKAAATPEGLAGKGTSDSAPEKKLMASSDLPLAIQQELPHLSLAMHVYSSKPQDRLVSINNRLLREGDYLTPELRLEQVTPDGVIFTYRGYRFRRGVE